jgi:hypothetical protein
MDHPVIQVGEEEVFGTSLTYSGGNRAGRGSIPSKHATADHRDGRADMSPFR